MNPKKSKGLGIYLAIAALIFIVGISMYSTMQPKETLKYYEIMNYFDDYKVSQLTLNQSNNMMTFTVDGKEYTYKVPSLTRFVDDVNIEDYRKEYDSKHSDKPFTYDVLPPQEYSFWLSMLPTLFLIGAMVFLWIMMMRQSGGGGGKISSFGKVKPKPAEDGRRVTFDDVAGADEEKEELVEIIEFLKSPSKFNALGARIPKGVLLMGPPGTGKSMLAKRVPTILPPMTFEESIQISKVHSVAGLLRSQKGLVTSRPFRAPHHSVSPAGLSGGGSTPMPGEISLAHNGVLFLDEFPEFSRSAIETLRQPMEDGVITISRARSRITYPCNIMVIAAMNPCPCGYLGHPTKPCICTKQAANRYFSKISGPMLDRLDLQTEVLPVDFDTLSSSEKPESSSEILKRVTFARNIQQQRFLGTDVTCNASMSSAMTAKYCTMSEQANTFLRRAFDTLGLSPRAYDRILRVSRTIADLDGCDNIEISHISLAVQYRSLDRKYFTKA
ncbi:MAG: ATP-binding protein, partial [Oscillospiraceae bacterium]